MVRRLLATVPIIALSVALVAPNDAAAANACKKACAANKKQAIADAKAARTACLQAAADKTAKKACKTAFKAAKKSANQTFNPKAAGCKANPTSTCNGGTTTTTTLLTCNGTPGQPSEATVTVPATGSDLDNGYSGSSHNFVVVHGSTLHYCLSGCDASTTSTCQAQGQTGAGTANTQYFGAPLPLLSVGVPVCVVNTYVDPTISATLDLATGEMSGDVKLTSKVYVRIGKGNLVCPRCGTGNTLGETAKCQGGARDGQSCTVNGVVDVAGSTPKTYAVSTDCPPEENPAGIGLAIDLPLTTAVAHSAAGPLPCKSVGQTHDDSCVGGSCSADCSGSPDPGGKGGLNQTCCAGGSAAGTPCFPTKSGGTIDRTGTPSIPQPAWPDPTYPKSTPDGQDVKLVATFCIAKTGDASVDNNAGLPGPGAIILPGKLEVFSAQ